LHVGDTTIPRLTCMQALSVAEQVDQSSLVGSNNVEIWNQCRIECPTPLTELLFIPCDLFWNVVQLQIPYCRDLAQPTAACGLIYCNLIPGMHDNSHRRSKSTHKAEPQKYHPNGKQRLHVTKASCSSTMTNTRH
jgi:hypothetical protein